MANDQVNITKKELTALLADVLLKSQEVQQKKEAEEKKKKLASHTQDEIFALLDSDVGLSLKSGLSAKDAKVISDNEIEALLRRFHTQKDVDFYEAVKDVLGIVGGTLSLLV